MYIKERSIRVVGYLVVTAIFFIFFMLEMFFTWKDEYMFPKVLSITILHTLLIWEPTRFLILKLRKGYAGLKNVRKRLRIATLVLVPYAFLIGFSRIYLEDVSNLWNVPVAHIASYSYTIGISLLFILLEVAVYEGLYFFSEWNKSQTEAEALKRVNFQVQLDSLKVQIQPHFLFNTLNTLIGLIEADSKRAVKFTEDLAFVYRYLLQANDRALISLEEELQFTSIYFSLLKTRFPDGLYLTKHINTTEAFELPPLSLHILLENAVKHNSISNAKPLYITITYQEEDQRIVVSNNIQPKPPTNKSGKGLSYLDQRFELLSLPQVIIDKSADAFSVSIPLIRKYMYESVNY